MLRMTPAGQKGACRSLMSPWPPSVLVATHQDVVRYAVREMLRNSGIRELTFVSSADAALSVIEREAWKWNVLILEARLPSAMEVVQKLRGAFAEGVKTILIISGPTRETILEAIQAGVSDIVTYPFSEATLEKKLRKLTHATAVKADEEANRRRGPRFDLPAVVVAPELSDFPLVPEDLSAGGFRVAVTKPPVPNTDVEFSLEVADLKFEGRRARIAWVRENPTPSPSWSVGLGFEMEEQERTKLEALLRKIAAEKDAHEKSQDKTGQQGS